MTARLLAVDLLLVLLTPLVWVAVPVVAIRSRRGGGRLGVGALLAVGLLVLAGRAAVALVLVGRSWAFAQEKLTLTLPLAALPAVWAAVVIAPALFTREPLDGPRLQRSVAASVTTVAAGVAGVAVALVVGYPVGWVDRVSWAVVVAVVAAIAVLVATGRPRRPVPALAVLGAVSLLSPALLAFGGSFAGASPGGGGHTHGHGHGTSGSVAAHQVSVADLRTPPGGGPVRRFDLVAARQSVTLPSGAVVDGVTFGSLPGPEIRVTQGDLVEVALRNKDVAEGVTLHWHGYDVPNGEDGVAGVTQDAVPPGSSFTYRLRADDVGTYWYHSHQRSSVTVPRGLYGSLVVVARDAPAELDLVLPVHTVGESVLLGGSDQPAQTTAPAGSAVRLRLVNTDDVPNRLAVAGAEYRVVAVDGRDVVGPTPVTGHPIRLPAGGRVDVALTMPAGPVTVAVEGAPRARMSLSPPGVAAGGSPDFAAVDLDLLGYGTPTVDGTDPVARTRATAADVDRTLVLDRLVRFRAGVPAMAYTVDGAVYPNVRPIEVDEGDLVKLTVVNRGAEPHPMHPHGHHVLVLSRNGTPASGSPLWLDSFDVLPGEVWEVALHADNPGIWMAHCHKFAHATGGMVVHLNYRSVTTPFGPGGPTANHPE